MSLAEALHLAIALSVPLFHEIASEKCTYFSLNNDAVDNLSQASIRVRQHPHALNRKNISRFDRKLPSSI